MSRLYETVAYILVKQGLLPCLSKAVTSHAHSGQLIEFPEIRFCIHMV
jgi:hypothetical protein